VSSSSAPTNSPADSPVELTVARRRQAAADRVGLSLESLTAHQPLPAVKRPTADQEIWRYSRVAKIPLDGLTIAGPGSQPTHAPAPLGEPSASVHLVDGFVRTIQISDAASAAGLVVRSASGTDATVPMVTVDGGDVFVDLALACAAEALVIEVPRGAAIPGVVQIVNEVSASGAFIPASVSVRLGEHASLSVVERVVGDAVGSLFAPVTLHEVADGATLRFVTIQELGDQCFQVAHQQSTTGRDATLRSMAVALGGSYARVRTDATLTAPGGFNELLAVYFGAGHQMHDFRTLQHHIGPRTTSELLFKGAVEDHSQSVYSGLIRIGEQARNAVANQTNRNLLLSSTASVESVPNLEIENNEVKCSHASAVGPVDEDHRYYLELRGVPPEEAERLIVTGFFNDVLDRSPVPGVADALMGVFAAKFRAADMATSAVSA
jgi:Fe-S cluster assembly protein SufD